MQRFPSRQQTSSRMSILRRNNIWERLVTATLRCRLCGRPVGDLVGYLSEPLEEARFIPLPTGALPHTINGVLRCAHCHGQLCLDDVEPLGRGVSLAEVGGPSFADVLARAPRRSHASAA
jgi:hypothetical protein